MLQVPLLLQIYGLRGEILIYIFKLGREARYQGALRWHLVVNEAGLVF